MNPLFGNSLPSTILDVSSFTLTTLRDAARASHLPYLSEVATLALGILTAVQDMRDCREGFHRLARDVCNLVSAVIEVHSGNTPPGSGLRQDIQTLVETLTSILDFAKQELSKGILRRMINHRSDHAKIAEYREALRQSLDVFENELLRQFQELRGLLRGAFVLNVDFHSPLPGHVSGRLR